MSLTLLEFCRRNERTVSDVARSAGLDPKWLYKVAKGERGFSLETAAKIEKATSGAVTLVDLNNTRKAWLASPEGIAAEEARRERLTRGKRNQKKSPCLGEAA
jgi:DNA-binding transcriptional regulator YdaS (Cro superfamily)